MYHDRTNLIVSILIVGFIAFSIGVASPLGDGFTYQGRLTDANLVADGPYDFLFSLYDANDGGFQVATPHLLPLQEGGIGDEHPLSGLSAVHVRSPPPAPGGPGGSGRGSSSAP